MKLRPFELALVIIFAILGVTALIMLKTFSGGESDPTNPAVIVGTVTIWGTLPAEGINKILYDLGNENEAYKKVYYKYYRPDDFDSVLLKALADGVGPDLVIVSQEKLVAMRKRIQPVSYQSFPIRDVRDLYLDGAQIFALSDGLYGYPIAVDPLMMYWNRDILATEGFLEAPRTWEVLINNMFPKLIKRDFDRTIRRSVVAMGEYNNVRNAFGIVSMLLIQGGSERVVEDTSGSYQIKLRVAEDGSSDPLRIAADFYTRFSKPSNSLYSWNRSFDEDRLQFIAEDLALYFGYASEGPQIEKSNPNLNFDIAEVPQGADATVRRTYGKFYAISLLKSSDNISGASSVMLDFGGVEMSKKIALASDMVPAYRSLVSAGSNGTYGRVSYQSAPIALGWLNPTLSTTNPIFATMLQDINENRRDIDGATFDTVTRLEYEY